MLDGIERLLIFVVSKAFFSIVNNSEKVTVSKLSHSKNAPLSMIVTWGWIEILEIQLQNPNE